MSGNSRVKDIRFDDCPYSLDSLKHIVAKHSAAPRYALVVKPQLDYLNSYLNDPDIVAASILTEEDYIDRDFLADYAGYYVRCFYPYERWCARLHFFSCTFTKEDILKLVRGEAGCSLTANELQGSYLGFVVVKPLPETMIGRTCLKTYKIDNGRAFPGGRKYQANLFGYQANLFGLELSVKSLAFQEQDTVAAACASSALWTAFQGTGLLFQHDLPSPLAITRLANERIPSESRPLPASDGLSDPQMAEAVRGVGLDPLMLPIDSNWTLRATTYAYLYSEIPVVWLGLVVGELPSAKPPAIHKASVASEDVGGHAITMVGYRSDGSLPLEPHPVTGLLLRASRISRMYAHDDNIGPFARVEIEPCKLALEIDGNAIDSFDWFSCRWAGTGHAYVSQKVLVPLFTTIRIPFSSILSSILLFDDTLETLRVNGKAQFGQRFEWDIHLIASNSLKSEYFDDSLIDHAARQDLLLSALPRYIWRAEVYAGDAKKLDFLFGSTDIEQGLKLLKIVSHDATYYDELLKVADVYSTDPSYPAERLGDHGKMWEYLRELFEDQRQKWRNNTVRVPRQVVAGSGKKTPRLQRNSTAHSAYLVRRAIIALILVIAMSGGSVAIAEGEPRVAALDLYKKQLSNAKDRAKWLIGLNKVHLLVQAGFGNRVGVTDEYLSGLVGNRLKLAGIQTDGNIASGSPALMIYSADYLNEESNTNPVTVVLEYCEGATSVRRPSAGAAFVTVWRVELMDFLSRDDLRTRLPQMFDQVTIDFVNLYLEQNPKTARPKK